MPTSVLFPPHHQHQLTTTQSFLSWLALAIHTHPSFRTVGALGLLNEPTFNSPLSPHTQWTLSTFYPTAIAAIRATETYLSVPSPCLLTLTIMDDLWHDLSGATDPAADVRPYQQHALLFDDHNYQMSPVANKTPADVLAYACADDRRTARQPGARKLVGEWAMSVTQKGAGFTPEMEHKRFWSAYFAAQQRSYERTRGWVWWTWKAEAGPRLGNWLQWSYKGECTFFFQRRDGRRFAGIFADVGSRAGGERDCEEGFECAVSSSSVRGV